MRPAAHTNASRPIVTITGSQRVTRARTPLPARQGTNASPPPKWIRQPPLKNVPIPAVHRQQRGKTAELLRQRGVARRVCEDPLGKSFDGQAGSSPCRRGRSARE